MRRLKREKITQYLNVNRQKKKKNSITTITTNSKNM